MVYSSTIRCSPFPFFISFFLCLFSLISANATGPEEKKPKRASNYTITIQSTDNKKIKFHPIFKDLYPFFDSLNSMNSKDTETTKQTRNLLIYAHSTLLEKLYKSIKLIEPSITPYIVQEKKPLVHNELYRLKRSIKQVLDLDKKTGPRLEILKKALELKQEEERQVIHSKNTEPFYTPKKPVFFVHNLVESALKDQIKTIADEDLFNLYLLADILQIRPLIDAYASFLAERLKPDLESNIDDLKSKNICDSERDQVMKAIEITLFGCFGNEQPYPLIPIKKYLFLKHYNQQDQSIKEYLVLHPTQPVNGFLDLKGKGISSLKGLDELRYPEQITKLDLSNNSFLPKEFEENKPNYPFEKLRNLTELNLSFNPGIHIDSETLRGLKKLKKLDLSHNQLRKIPPHFFQDQMILQELNLTCNHIHILESGTLNLPENILELKLSRNHITKIDPEALNGLRSLERLYLDDNEISSFLPATFDKLLELRLLDLSKNRLTSPPDQIFSRQFNLKELFVTENPFTNSLTNRHTTVSNLSSLISGFHHLSNIPERFLSTRQHQINHYNEELTSFQKRYGLNKYTKIYP